MKDLSPKQQKLSMIDFQNASIIEGDFRGKRNYNEQ